MTLADLIAWAVEHGVDARGVSVPWPTLNWESPETQEEAVERIAANRRTADRHDRWERETYERLRARFETDGGEDRG